MSCETETAVTLRHAGQKVTPQGMLTLCTVRPASHPVTAGQVLDEVKRSYPFVDASTVYRTLGSAAALGLVSETDMGAGDTQYEWIGKDRHHHLICRSCGGGCFLDKSYPDSVGAAPYDEQGVPADLGHFAIFCGFTSCRG